MNVSNAKEKEDELPKLPSHYLHKLIVNNFKSYKGEHLIGPFLPFTCIIGPNGSGKSNIMDAVSFVLGLKTSILRAHKLSDFIYRGSDELDESQESRSMYVTAVFRKAGENGFEDDTDMINNVNIVDEISFTREVSSSSPNVPIYRVNGKVKQHKDYLQQLKGIGLDVEAQNFLIFQGDVEGIVQITPKERTGWFEKVSDSAELINEYEELKELVERSDTETSMVMMKKRTVTHEQRIFLEQKKESERFQQLMDERTELEAKATLFRLYHIEKSIAAIDRDIAHLKATKQAHETALKNATVEWEKAKKKEAEHRKKLVEAEQSVIVLGRKADSTEPTEARDAAAVKRAKESADIAKDKVARLQKEIQNENEKMKVLEERLAALDQKYQMLESGEDMEEEEEEEESSNKRGKGKSDKQKTGKKQLKLSEEQLAEYIRLKETVEKELVSTRQQLDDVLLPQQNNDSTEAEKRARRIAELDAKRARAEESANDAKEKREKIVMVREKEAEEKKQKAEEDLHSAKEQIEKLKSRQTEIADLIEQQTRLISAARCDIRETAQMALLRETVTQLSAQFPGVKGTLHQLVDLSHTQFEKAVTTAMGSRMNAIVVDTEQTAKACLRFIRENRIGSGGDSGDVDDGRRRNRGRRSGAGRGGAGSGFTSFTFLPLDTLNPKPLQESLRISLKATWREKGRSNSASSSSGIVRSQMSEPQLMMDLLHFDSQYTPAVLYAVGSTVVVPTLEDAMTLAFGSSMMSGSSASASSSSSSGSQSFGGMRIRVVSLDGDIISKKGLITCGSPAVAARAQVWGQKEAERAKNERARLVSERTEIARRLRAEEEKAMMAEISLKGMGEVLIGIKAEREMLEEREAKEEKELSKVMDELTKLTKDHEEKSIVIQQRQKTIDELLSFVKDVEDKVFKDFCERLNIPSIRVFEQVRDEQQKQRESEMHSIEVDKARLISQIELMKARSSALILKSVLNEEKKANEKLRKAEEQHKKSSEAVQQLRAEFEAEREKQLKVEAEWRLAEEALINAQRARQAVAEDISSRTLSIEKLRGEKSSLQSRRDTLFTTARMDEIKIPTVTVGESIKKKDDSRKKKIALANKKKKGEDEKKKSKKDKRMEESESSEEEEEPMTKKKRGRPVAKGGKKEKAKKEKKGGKGAADVVELSDESDEENEEKEDDEEGADEEDEIDIEERVPAGQNLMFSETIDLSLSQVPSQLELSQQITASSSSSSASSSSSSSSILPVEKFRIDFKSLSNALKALNEKEAEAQQETYNEQLRQLNQELSEIVPNLHAGEQLEEVEERLNKLRAQFAATQEKKKRNMTLFQTVKAERRKRFLRAFSHMQSQIGGIYAELTRGPAGVGHAILELENKGDEPYLGGVKFHTMPPSKGFREMESLSGGEKTIAALAFMFAFNSFKPSPFILLDEVDAALDNVNVARAAAYIRRRSNGELTKHRGRGFNASPSSMLNDRTGSIATPSLATAPFDLATPTPLLSSPESPFGRLDSQTPTPGLQMMDISRYPLQCIVISLKGQFFEWADLLVGITRNIEKESSDVYTVDLRQYSLDIQ
ncbi:Structural maintenance of chromosomes 1, SMC1 [Monocercomonoides exilis]|uniref:Structural maintenance of chromosomes 1, SMC1 n=1 Tax=Monocercomonoides exilis TaxID=2049356 RepID=UPI00355A60CE|nr:Structural maintenance of chromosomes 1, SMC1 [Monocercomonoides exilis]|eukprot:MONOS_13502.1-p1 / transcript=MONOS_13502.1 / gene=MONOS_13502 / organism=Monocercomonoides_exilis_PA203 / gene_product=Structural maintenance of chromosomes 1, SMC1 / transcript_product=Structural maintenance of chromosomes 1, SMC1 / location=Mono_scaffold00837:7267-12907(-) / protein_length=1568 / sequence_SO=supercontig / SO=protein_coding / is_pseudo=false